MESIQNVLALKIGGGSITGNEKSTQKLIEILDHYDEMPENKIYVISALGGVTNILSCIVDCLMDNSEALTARNLLVKLRKMHINSYLYETIINDKMLPSAAKEEFVSGFEEKFLELENYVEQNLFADHSHRLKEIYDKIVPYGEKLALHLIYYLMHFRYRDVMCLNDNFIILNESEDVDFKKTVPLIQKLFLCEKNDYVGLRAKTILCRGFTCNDSKGIETTLGREGSDVSLIMFMYAFSNVTCNLVKNIQSWDDSLLGGQVTLSQLEEYMDDNPESKFVARDFVEILKAHGVKSDVYFLEFNSGCKVAFLKLLKNQK